MKFWRILKLTLGVVLVAGIIQSASMTSYCTEGWYNDTNVQEHISKVEEQLKAAGYTLNRTMDNSNSGQAASTDSPASKQEPNITVKSCDHTYVDLIIKEPTCAEPGVMESKCSKCGDIYKTEIPATGKHEYTSEIKKEATCTEKGEITYTCTECGDSYTEEIATTGHKYDSTVAEAATCTTDGTIVYKCEVCDDSYTEVIPASGHKESELTVVKQPGLFTKGEQQITCEYCGEILSSEVIPSILPAWTLVIPVVIIAAIFILFVIRRKAGQK